MSTKRVCVIGVGSSGLVAVKECLAANFDVVCYEKGTYLGGLWRYHEDDVPDVASIMKSTVLNTSKELTALSDFPPPEHFPNQMHNSIVARYFDLYADKYYLHPHIRYSHQVVKVVKADIYATTGQWRVTVRNVTSGHLSQDTFDGVMICTGHHTKPFLPKFTGQNKFKGRVIHSHSYKNASGFEDMNVVVVGVGNSGGDAAVEISTVAKQVYLSTRTGVWVNSRIGPNGLPFDMGINSRYPNTVMKLLPHEVKCRLLENRMNKRFNHATYNLKPAHRPLSQHIMINDGLPNRILSGTVAVKSNIKEFTENGVIFEGEVEETPCDVVILATGYLTSIPFLDKDIIKVEGNKTELYKFMFPPHLEHPHTLACIGFIQPMGAYFPVFEIQSRWFVHLLLGKGKLPPAEDMMRDVTKTWHRKKQMNFEKLIRTNWIEYMDTIASEIGAKPNLTKYFFTDIVLWKHLLFGPCVAYQYRLKGPYQWSGAKDAIIGTMDRIQAALNTRSTLKRKPKYRCLISKFLHHM